MGVMRRERLSKVLIWGKTTPQLSTKHMETVCTGGCLEDGSPVRLFPIPFRYLAGDRQFHLYQCWGILLAQPPPRCSGVGSTPATSPHMTSARKHAGLTGRHAPPTTLERA